jgi:hypothetical protein
VTFFDRLQVIFGQLAEFLPPMLGAIGILFVGYLLARISSRALGAILRRTRFNELFARGGFHQGIDRAGHPFNPTRVVTNLVFWMMMFAVILIAANALGLDSLSTVFNELVGYIPSVIGAIVIIIVGIVLGSFVSGLILASAGGIEGGTTLARVGRGGVIILAIFMALQEIGIAGDIVTVAFGILFGAIALALALAFGLGNRELAGEVTRQWYEKYKAERDAVERETQLSLLADEAETGPASPGPKRTIPVVDKTAATPDAKPPAAAG